MKDCAVLTAIVLFYLNCAVCSAAAGSFVASSRTGRDVIRTGATGSWNKLSKIIVTWTSPPSSKQKVKFFSSSQDFSGFSSIIIDCASSHTRLENSDLYSILGLETKLVRLMRWCGQFAHDVRIVRTFSVHIHQMFHKPWMTIPWFV